MTGPGPVLACAGYAGLLWVIALTLDAVGRRSRRRPHGSPREEASLDSDVARFHRAIAGGALGAGAFLGLACVAALRQPSALLLVPVAAACLAGAYRRLAPLWREP